MEIMHLRKAMACISKSSKMDGYQLTATAIGNPGGIMYNLSLSIPFDKQTNLTGLFKAMPKNGGPLRNNIAPNYNDGVMFANDNEFILYGSVSSS